MQDIEIKLVRGRLYDAATEGTRHVGGTKFGHKDMFAKNVLWYVVMHLINGNQS